MSASSTTSTTDDNRSEHEELTFSKKAKTPLLMTTSRSDYGVSEYSSNTGSNAHRTLGAMVSTSTISTLDRSAYQSLPLSGTRRITVQFGDIKIVVPWKDSASGTVGDLANAALLRYKRACGNNSVKINRLECASDGGILDWDDVLEDVFDLAFDQILAITDDGTPQHHYAQPFPVNRRDLIPVASAYGSVSVQNPVSYTSTSNSTSSSSHKSRRDSIIEVKNLQSPISPGLRVHKTPTGIRNNMEDLRISTENEPILRSSLRNNQENVKKMQQARVTLSPEVEKKLAEREKPRYEKNTSANRLLRSSDRKSRINDAFLDSRDRIVEKMGEKEEKSMEKETKKGPVLEGPMPGTTIVTFLPPENDMEVVEEMGLEVNAVYDESISTPSTSTNSQNQKLSAVQIMKIEKNGRIGKDGRLKVGDSIVEIDGRPVYQMSILRARAYIADLAVSTKPVTLTILRPIDTFSDENNIDQKPIFSALQAANTQYIGQTQIVELVKSSNGFGFTVTGRETAKGERLFYIGTVKPYGVALGHLKSGDRLLEINGESTGNLSQLEIVDRLKQAMVGEKVKFLVSRVAPPAITQATNENNKENVENPETSPAENEKDKENVEKVVEIPENERFDLIIPLNDSGSAGLGVSLKARVSVKSDGSRNDCGIFIKNVMHGGAAFKDGRLKINDRIVGIEDIELETLTNSAASESLTRKLKSIGPSMSHVKLSIIRESSKKAGPISRDSSRITATSPSISSSILSPITVSSDSHSRQSSKEDETILENATDDPFDREAPGRKSLSEKRGIGAANGDPQHIKLFQEIKHQRQNSAPPASTSRNAAAKRSKSQPRSFSQRNYQRKTDTGNVPEPPAASTLPREKPIDAERSGILNRRSLSMESINPSTSSPATSSHLIPNSTSSGNFSTPGGHPFPPGASPLLRRKNNEEKMRQSDKSRRKSVGNAMRNFFGFGNSKSRDASPEKQQISSSNEMKIRPAVFMDHGEPYQVSDPLSPPIILGNSRFYSSCRGVGGAQKNHNSPAHQISDTAANLRHPPPIRNSTADTRRIDIRQMPKMHSIGEMESDRRAARIDKTRPMSTMDYQHLIRTMSSRQQQQQHPMVISPKAEVIQRPHCVEPMQNHISKTIINKSTLKDQQEIIHKNRPQQIITTPSTRGLPIREEEQLAQRQCYSTEIMGAERRMDRQFASLPHRQYVMPHMRKELQVEGEGDREIVMRRKSMRMLQELNPPPPYPHHIHNNNNINRPKMVVDRPVSLYHDTVAVSHQQHFQRPLHQPPPPQQELRQIHRNHNSLDDAVPRMATDANNRHKSRQLIVFPSTRFPIASSSLRVKPAPPPKLAPTSNSNSNFYVASNRILPPSTSSIMSTN